MEHEEPSEISDLFINMLNSLPIEFEGIELLLEPCGKRTMNVHIKTSQSGSVPLTRFETLYFVELIRKGYVRKKEFLKKSQIYNCVGNVIDTQIKNLNKKLRKIGKHDLIKNRSPSWEYEGGYFIGDLSQHRNEPENLVSWNGYQLNTVTGCFTLPDGQTVNFNPLETKYLQTLIDNGYVTRQELWSGLHSEDTFDRIVDTHIKEIRRKLKEVRKKDLIKTRSASLGYEGGYFIDDLSQHRNEPENLVRLNGYQINTVTGCFTLPDGQTVNFTPLQTEYLKILFKKDNVTREMLWNKFHPDDTPDEAVDKNIGKIRAKLRVVGERDMIVTEYGVGYSLKAA